MECIGKVLGNRYEVIEEIGSGGMATVYKAKCKLLNRYVAIKVLRDEFANDSEFIKRFQVEAQSAASLSHQNIVSIYDVGYEDGMHYIVMELIEGRTLKEIIKERGKLPWKEAVYIASQIASGLSQAHQNHIVHRDIKPHNIIMTKNGIAKVTDFGIAKAVSNSTINAFGSTIGSVHYFSPEHARGGYTDEKSDIYSLGVVLYEMCTGRLPFEGETPVAVALKHISEEPKQPISICPDLPQAVNNIILKAMKKDPLERYSSASEMYEDLKKVLNNPNIEVAQKNKEGEFSPTQRIPVIRMEKNIVQQPTIEKINKYKNEQDDDNMSRKKKITKSMAIARLLLIIAFVVLLFWGSINLGEFLSIKILGAPKDVKVPPIVGYSLEEATRLLQNEGLEIGDVTDVVDNKYPKGYIVWQSTVNTVKIGSKIDVQVSLGQKTVLVPDVTKFEETNAAKAQIEASGLVYKEEEEYSNTIEKGKIIKQDPNVNAEVVEGSTVTVYISAGPLSGDGLVKVPSVMGYKEDIARGVLDSEKLIVKVVEDYDTTKKDGVVIKQNPEAESTVPELTEVTIVVNKLTGTTKPEGNNGDNQKPNSGDNQTSSNNPTKPTVEQTGKRYINIDLSSKGDTETFSVRVVVEGKTVAKKVVYDKLHKRSDGMISVPIADETGIRISVYIDDKLDSEQVL